jgi:GH15 family glucan-1,4-alpha-glucosidase
VTVTPSSGAAGSADAQDGLPIAEYGLLSDCSSASLVSRSGSIDWLCLPRFDSPAVFARILDPRAGHWSIRPAHSYRADRRYLPGSLAIETTFTTDAGSVRLLDVMASRPGQRGHDHGLDPPHEVLRLVEGVSGRVEFAMELAPRPARSSARRRSSIAWPAVPTTSASSLRRSTRSGESSSGTSHRPSAMSV